MTPREGTSLDRFRRRVESGKETKSAIAESMGLSPSAISALIAGLNALKFTITSSPRQGRKASATTKTVIAAKAMRKYTNGAHAR